MHTSDVRATMRTISRSVAPTATSMGVLNSSRNSKLAFFAVSNPSTSTRGCIPSARYRSHCFSSSPISSTVDDVPSLHHARRG